MLLITWTPSLIIIACGLLAYAVIALCLTSIRLFSRSHLAGLAAGQNHGLKPADLVPLIERPFNHLVADPTGSTENDLVGDGWEFADDNDSLLLKEAEKVVEQIQGTIDHIASNPPNPTEVSSKINAIVKQYKIFENTEYFEAINSFIAVSVERDCKIQYSKEDLLALWN